MNKYKIPQDKRLVRQTGCQILFTKNILTDQHVVIKQVPMGSDNIELRQLQQEAEVLNKIGSCPYIIKYYESFIEEKSLYIVMQYANSMSLFDFVQKKVCVEHIFQNDALRNKYYVIIKAVFQQAFEALLFLHKNHIMHRDLQPSNIMMHVNLINGVQYLEIKIIDFGYSQFLQFTKQSAKSQYGTLFYTPLEILLNNTYTIKADIYSLGACLYYCLMGDHPYSNKLGQQVRIKKLQSLINSLPSVQFPLKPPKVFLDVLDASMRIKIEDRQEIADILQIIRQDTEIVSSNQCVKFSEQQMTDSTKQYCFDQ